MSSLFVLKTYVLTMRARKIQLCDLPTSSYFHRKEKCMNLNTKGKEENSFDAIVVGSGISGGWAAKELCEKGLKVLTLERGKPVEHPNYPTSTKDPWDFEHRSRLTIEEKERSHI